MERALGSHHFAIWKRDLTCVNPIYYLYCIHACVKHDAVFFLLRVTYTSTRSLCKYFPHTPPHPYPQYPTLFSGIPTEPKGSKCGLFHLPRTSYKPFLGVLFVLASDSRPHFTSP